MLSSSSSFSGPPVGFFPAQYPPGTYPPPPPTDRAIARSFPSLPPLMDAGGPSGPSSYPHSTGQASTRIAGGPMSPTSPSTSGSSYTGAHVDVPPMRAAAIAATSGITRAAATTSPTGKKPPAASNNNRDSKRKATHSQIERRRREKINDRLVTLRNIVPACAQELAARQEALLREDDDGEEYKNGVGMDGNARNKRKRARRKAAAAAAAATAAATNGNKEAELGLHKLDVLTHAIDYIYELEARVQELETGVRPAKIKRVDRGNEDDDEDEELADQRSLHPPPVLISPVQRKVDKVSLPTSKMSSRTQSLRNSRANSSSSETASELSTYGQDATSPFFTSPNFGGTASTTPTSALPALTSPFMSLSASSPIFLSPHSGNSKVATTTMMTAGSAAETMAKFALPPAVMPLDGQAATYSNGSRRMSRPQHGSLSAIRGSQGGEEQVTMQAEVVEDHRSSTTKGKTAPAAAPEDASAAELLLSISSSPEERAAKREGNHLLTSPPLLALE